MRLPIKGEIGTAIAEGMPSMNNRKVRVSGVVISAIKADIAKPNASPPPIKVWKVHTLYIGN